MANTEHHTLRTLALVLLGICAALAAADLFRGTGGSAWWSSTARAEATPTGPSSAVADPDGTTIFRAVRYLDGATMAGPADVLVAGGKIAAIGDTLEASADAVVIEGAGMTLLPGLIDSHTHTWGTALRAALMLGVTTELDMFTEPGSAAVLRGEQARGEANDRADLFSAGYLVTSPGGHGTEYGMEIPTLTRPEDADAFVQARMDEGSDYIKIVYDAGSIGREFTTLDLPTVRAVIEAAHARDLLAVVHVSREADALAVIDAGADGIVHVFYDKAASDEAVAAIAASGAFVVPTLSVIESVSGGDGGAQLIGDAELAPYIAGAESATLKNVFPGAESRGALLQNALESVRKLHAAGVRILAGTDSPNPGTAHGASMHREIELLVHAGLSPTEALAAATTVPAAAFGLTDRGSIAVGLRADLALVRGNPAADVLASRVLAGVWKAGVAADRDGYVAMVAAERMPAATAEVAPDGLIADFESGEIASAFGSGWAIQTDSMIGGSSTAAMSVEDGGARSTAKSMRIAGTIVAGSGPAVWAGPMFFPGVQQFAPANLAEYEGISFWVRGDGHPVTVMLFAQSLGQIPAMRTVATTEEWSEHRMAFSDFQGVDAAGLQAVLFSGTEAGDFDFRLDEFGLW